MSDSMALADFFSLTEIKEGLSSPDRVEDLINILRFENDKEVKNVEEMSRQWSAVAKTIACTDNKECLECFVQLGGLRVFNTWLNNILKNAGDIRDGVMEEPLLTLLQALEKLPVDNEKLTSTGVGITLKSLAAYSSSLIKERVHELLDNRKLEVDVDVEEDIPVNCCTKAGIKSNENRSIETSHLDMNNEVETNTGTPDFLSVEEVKDVANEECGSEVGAAETETLDHEALKDGKSVDSHSTDLCTEKENNAIIGSMSADVDTELTNTENESYSNSKTENEVGLLKQNVGVLADVGRSENEVTNNSAEQTSNSCIPETEGGSLKLNDGMSDEDAIKAAKKDFVMAEVEGLEVEIPDTVCSSSQENMLNGQVEQVLKSLPQTVSSDSKTAKAALDGTVLSDMNAVVQEAEIETGAVLGFDLNEEVLSEDLTSAKVLKQELNCDANDHQIIYQTSRHAATSAFRPASPRKSLASDNITSSIEPSSNSLDQRQNIHGFDLNIFDDPNADTTPDSIIAVSSSHPSDESCVEICPSKSKRAEMDLNNLSDAPTSAYWSVNDNNGLLSRQNGYRSPSSAASSSSLVHTPMWDLDLNKKFSVPNFHHDPPQDPGNPTINFFDIHGAKKPDASKIYVLGQRVEVSRDESLFQSQLHPNGNIINSNLSQPLQSFMYRPGTPITMFDPRVIGPSQPPYLMNMIAAPPPSQALTGVSPPSYSSFDPNTRYMNDTTNPTAPHKRQYLMGTQGGFLELHSTPISQPAKFLTKRKEPHNGWDPYHHGFNHREFPEKS